VDGDVKAYPTVEREDLEEEKPRRGADGTAGNTDGHVDGLHARLQSPEDGARRAGAVGQPTAGEAGQPTRGQDGIGDESIQAVRGGKTPEGQNPERGSRVK